MFDDNAFAGMGIFVAVYLALLWAGIRWALSRVNLRARSVATALEGQGARVHATRPSAHIWDAAEIDFEVSGKKARAEVRQWGRDTHSISVHIDARPLPALWIRREIGLDKMSKAIGLGREVQVGDADFDKAVYIVSGSPDAVVGEVLGPSEVRRVVQRVVHHGFSVFMSQEGLTATALAGFWSNFNEADLVPTLRLLEELAAALPPTDPAIASKLLTPPSPTRMVLPVMLASLAVMVLFLVGGSTFVHSPIRDAHVAMGLLGGLVLFPPGVYLAVRKLRNRPLAIFELLFISIFLLCSVPFAGGFALFGVNSLLDRSAPTHRSARVVGYYGRNSHTVWVVPGTDDAGRDKIIVPWSIRAVSVGDTLTYDAHPGALGWTWVTDVRLGP